MEQSSVKIYDGALVLDSSYGDNVMIGSDAFVRNVSLGCYCRLERRTMVFNSIIGDYSNIGYNSVVKNVNIGKFCSISWNVSIGGGNHHYQAATSHLFPVDKTYGMVQSNIEKESEPLSIGNDVWIGSGAAVLRGLTIGDGAVIGCGAVVTKSIPPYEIWAGVPARKIGERFSSEIVERLLKIRWWDWPVTILKEHTELFQSDLTSETLIEMEKISGMVKNDYS